MEFVETSIFTKYINKCVDDDSYRLLQAVLVAHPKTGKVIPGTAGARKIRWPSRRSGKSGGIRIIYFYAAVENRCYMLLAFRKNEQDNLTSAQKHELSKLILRYLK